MGNKTFILSYLDVRYDGSTNLLEMSRDYRIKYKCSFDVRDILSKEIGCNNTHFKGF